MLAACVQRFFLSWIASNLIKSRFFELPYFAMSQKHIKTNEFWIHHIQWIIFLVANSIYYKFFFSWLIFFFFFWQLGWNCKSFEEKKNSTQSAEKSSWTIWSWLNVNMIPTAWELNHTHMGGPPGPATGFCGGADLNKSQLTWNIHYIYHNY